MKTATLLTALIILPKIASAAGEDLASALDVPEAHIEQVDAHGAAGQRGVVPQLGPISAHVDGAMAMLTSGDVGRLQAQDAEDAMLSEGGHDPTEPDALVNDQSLLTMQLRVPDDAHSFTFQWYFLSREYPVYVGSDYNDRFTVWQDGAAYEGNIVFDEGGNVVDVNNALFGVTDEASLSGTGIWRPSGGSPSGYDGGGTGWVNTTSPVEPGELLSLRFDIHDVADQVYDSAVLLDGFTWNEHSVEDPISGPAVALRYLSPKSGPIEGAEHVYLVGRYFAPGVEVRVDGVLVEHPEFVGPEALKVTIPATTQPGLVDIEVRNGSAVAELIGGWTYTERTPATAAPVLEDVEPDGAKPEGGAEITIHGRGLSADDVVRFGDVQATEVERVSGTELRVTVPEHDEATVKLTVESSAGVGNPLPFVFGEGRDRPDMRAPVPGCNAGGGSGSGFALLLLLPFLRRRRAALAALFALALAGCSDNTLRALPGEPPTAIAIVQGQTEATAASATVSTGHEVVLDGTGSHGTRAALRYQWSLVDRPEGADLEPDGAVLSFRSDVPGDYLVELVVTDQVGRRSRPDAVAIRVQEGRQVVIQADWDVIADVDLHLLDEAAVYFGPGDCHFGVPQPAWGDAGEHDDPRYGGDADGAIDTPRREQIAVPSAPAGRYRVLLHHVHDRSSHAVPSPTLSLWIDGVEVSLPTMEASLEVGDVWQAFELRLPEGVVTMTDEVSTHEELGGPVLNRAVTHSDG